MKTIKKKCNESIFPETHANCVYLKFMVTTKILTRIHYQILQTLGVIGSGLRRCTTSLKPTNSMATMVTSSSPTAATTTTSMPCAACGRASVES